MQALNLYILTRSRKEFCTEYENVLACRNHVLKMREHEYETMVSLVEWLYENGADIIDFEGFYFSYVIEYIGKEFDLLKISQGNIVLNIELKSNFVNEEKIKKQLIRNQYYLKHLAPNIRLFTYQQETKQLYTLEGCELKECGIEKLIEVLRSIKNFETGDISQLFQAKDFLISPLNTPEKFINNNYFLTLQQEEIRNDIIQRGVLKQESLLWGITGSAGTGKTLLLYDLMKYCSAMGKCCVIHSGILCEGHNVLNDLMDNVNIIDAKSVNDDILLNYKYIFVDEAQRIYRGDLDTILKVARINKSLVVFSYDFFQTLSKAEVNRNTPDILRQQQGFIEKVLSDKIRTNKEVASFIRNLLDLRDVSAIKYKYNNIDVIFANDKYEAKEIMDLYKRNRGYIVIGYTQSKFYSNSIDNFPGDFNTHHVIGQEFDNVLIMMDNNFRYAPDGQLQGKEHPNPDYLFYKLFYQGISRAREKLCILVSENRELFEKILEIKFKNID